MTDKNTKVEKFEMEAFNSLTEEIINFDITMNNYKQNKYTKISPKSFNTKNKIVNILDNKDFNGNISNWNTSNIKEMEEVFTQYFPNTSNKNNDVNFDSATGIYSTTNIFKNIFEEEKTDKNKLSAFHRMITFFRKLFLSNKRVEKEITKIEVISKKPDFPSSDEFQTIYNQIIENINNSSSLFPTIVISHMSSLKDSYYKILENLDSLDESSKREVSKSIREFLPKLINSYMAIPLIEINGENSNQLKSQKILVEGIEEIVSNMKDAVLNINELKLSELSVVTRTIRATLK
jgi:hypothetical protein